MAVTKSIKVKDHPKSGKAVLEQWTDESRHGLCVPLGVLTTLMDFGKQRGSWAEKPYKFPELKLSEDIVLEGEVKFPKGTVIVCDDREVLSVKGGKREPEAEAGEPHTEETTKEHGHKKTKGAKAQKE